MKNDLYLQTVDSNPALRALLQSRSVLMLQGPVGPFFDRLALWLKGKGVPLVNRVAFSGGDLWDCKALLPMRFSGALVEWPIYLQNLISTFKVDCIVLFGQARPHHAKAVVFASLLGIKVVVVEEGYFRPHYLTMELGGVNGYRPRAPLAKKPPSTGMPPPVTKATRGEVEFAFVNENFALLVSDAKDLIKFFSKTMTLCDSLPTALSGVLSKQIFKYSNFNNFHNK